MRTRAAGGVITVWPERQGLFLKLRLAGWTQWSGLHSNTDFCCLRERESYAAIDPHELPDLFHPSFSLPVRASSSVRRGDARSVLGANARRLPAGRMDGWDGRLALRGWRGSEYSRVQPPPDRGHFFRVWPDRAGAHV